MNTKGLIEKRNELLDQQKTILESVSNEERALTDEEETTFETLEKDIEKLGKTIEMLKKKGDEMKTEEVKDEETTTDEERDIKEFANFVRAEAGMTHTRSEANFAKGDNGAVIPTTIANKIVKRVEELSPVYAKATKYKSKGTLNIPIESIEKGDIVVGFAQEFTEMESSSPHLETITLKGELYGALTKVSKSLLNNSDLNLTAWVIDKMARKIAFFVEGILLNGSSNPMNHIKGAGGRLVHDERCLEVAGTLTADDLIDLQDMVPDVFQGGAMWVMSSKTRSYIRKLKDNEGNYLLNPDASAKWGYTLFGKPVFVSDNVEDYDVSEPTNPAIFYGDFSGLAVKETESIEIQVLTERYATQHAIGINAWGEIDVDVEQLEALACAVVAAGASKSAKKTK